MLTVPARRLDAALNDNGDSMIKKRAILAAALLGAALMPAHADNLTIGLRIENVPDPHHFWSSNYIQYYRHYLGFMTDMNTDGKVVPSLAERYEAVKDGWVFHLRPNVKFSDGTDFDAKDVISSYERARDRPQAAGTYAGLFKGITAMTAVDPLTVKFTTDVPYQTLPFALSQIPIVPSEVAAVATQADFQGAKANVSIGPFRFVSYTPGQSLVLERNPGYWGAAPKWDKVTLRFMPDPAARVAALLAGDVDLIDGVPNEFVDRIRTNDRFALYTKPSLRDVFLEMDQKRDVTPFATDKDDKPLKANPFKDRRVREALSISIDRNAIRDRVMNGLAFPSGQIVTVGTGGYAADIAVPPYEPERAKRLLAEAGYPEGFGMTLHCTNDRYANDAKICQALGQMFARIGVKTKVMTLPSTAFFPLINPAQGEGLSIALLSWAASASGEADMLAQVIQTYNVETKTGVWNLGRYSNPEADKLIDKSNGIAEATERQAVQAEAMRLIMKDVAAIPLHDQSVVVATRKDILYTPMPDETTLAVLASKK